MLFWNGTPVDPEKNPVKAFDALFGGQTTTPPVNADVQLRKDLLAFTASEVQGLQTTLQSLTAENNKLATHLAAIQSLQADGNAMMPPSACSTKPNLASVEMVRTAERRQHAAAGRRGRLLLRREELPALARGAARADHAGDASATPRRSSG